MSEHTDDMLDGLFCQSCNVFMGDACGYPRSCKGCTAPAPTNPAKVNCPQCKKRVKAVGLANHMLDVHNFRTNVGPFVMAPNKDYDDLGEEPPEW